MPFSVYSCLPILPENYTILLAKWQQWQQWPNEQYRSRAYHNKARPHLKFVVNFKETDKRVAKFFKQKRCENFRATKEQRTGLTAKPSDCAIATAACKFGKNITDAVEFFLPHLQITIEHAHFANWSLNFCRPRRPMVPARLISSI